MLLPRVRPNFIRPSLHVMTTDPSGLVLDVQHEPEFNARVGDRDFDCALSRVVHGLLKMRVLVDVEHAPDLVEVGIPASRAPSSHVFLRPTDEGSGSHAGVCNVNDHLVSVETSPPGQIMGLRYLALGEDPEDAPRFPPDMVASREPAGRLYHGPVASVTSWNSAGSSTGTAP